MAFKNMEELAQAIAVSGQNRAALKEARAALARLDANLIRVLVL